MLLCPVCGNQLEQKDGSYRCIKGHCFDISSAGYVNLLLSGGKASGVHGDSKEMIRARQDFLSKGYYSFLSEEVNRIALGFLKGSPAPVVADVGCGEGYYTGSLCTFLRDHRVEAQVYGFDIAKYALQLAAKRCRQVTYAVASLSKIPLPSHSVDLLVDIFAPYSNTEFNRVVRTGGHIITAVPAEQHLFGLKKTLYESPYENVVKPYDLEGFEPVEIRRIRRDAQLNSQDDIFNLFMMTPYYWKTSREAVERLKRLDKLDTAMEFAIITYQKVHDRTEAK
ncbi:methyltransferase domain-containing protein [Phocea massiliensis]|uniref:23S rRNA (Guanine(745)-N(1))-methyltransferase n=1 Tax=uncultured Anaerotruncus sp. TaxID=905011 RepID=A0A6N2S423_9FIRM|nr:methyltransferase domain-containing protein [Merdimmobilis hominis]MCD4836393.1 methyltransferase domain-containing protein [Merdimmobilis hominis]